MSISGSQEQRLEELIAKYEQPFFYGHMDTTEIKELRWLAVQAYKEQRKQIAMMRGG